MLKPSWDQYLMSMAFVVSARSIDPSTKHGCVIVDREHTILSVGYNSPPRGCIDGLIPRVRPNKYPYFVHSEEAAIANAARNGVALRGGIAYVTGKPCPTCFRMMINAGIAEIVTGPIISACVDEAADKVVEVMMTGRTHNDLIVRSVSVDVPGLLNNVVDYYDTHTTKKT